MEGRCTAGSEHQPAHASGHTARPSHQSSRLPADQKLRALPPLCSFNAACRQERAAGVGVGRQLNVLPDIDHRVVALNQDGMGLCGAGRGRWHACCDWQCKSCAHSAPPLEHAWLCRQAEVRGMHPPRQCKPSILGRRSTAHLHVALQASHSKHGGSKRRAAAVGPRIRHVGNLAPRIHLQGCARRQGCKIAALWDACALVAGHA